MLTLLYLLPADQQLLTLAAGDAAFKIRCLPPDTNGLTGHTTKTILCVPVRQSVRWGNDLPSELMAKTACLKREKHVILIMNVKGFTACFGWGDTNWGIITCLNRIDFFFLCLLEFKMEMKEAAKWEKNRNAQALKMSQEWYTGISINMLVVHLTLCEHQRQSPDANFCIFINQWI